MCMRGCIMRLKVPVYQGFEPQLAFGINSHLSWIKCFPTFLTSVQSFIFIDTVFFVILQMLIFTEFKEVQHWKQYVKTSDPSCG